MAKADEARRRSGETKRRRTREALIKAGREVFTERGWKKTRMEDVAAEAGMGVATAYKHFKTKGALVAAIYTELAEPLPEATSIDDYINLLAATFNAYPVLTKCLLRAMSDDRVRVVAFSLPSDEDRAYVPLAEPLVELLQQEGIGREAVPHADFTVLSLLTFFEQYGELVPELIKQQIEWFKSFITGRVQGKR